MEVTTVVGPPLGVQQDDDPSDELVQAVQARYIEALQGLYQRHAKECVPNNKGLRIVA